VRRGVESSSTIELPDSDSGGNPQVAADKLGVRYYTSFRVISFDGMHFPIAETYEKGCWRKVVIGGRPYLEQHTAFRVAESAMQAQRVFLSAFQVDLALSRISMRGLINPVDNWKYELEAC